MRVRDERILGHVWVAARSPLSYARLAAGLAYCFVRGQIDSIQALLGWLRRGSPPPDA